jgi:hypothetical protein
LVEGILSLAGQGLNLEDIYDLPLDVFNLYVDGVMRLDARHRLEFVHDVSSAVGGVFSTGDGLKNYTALLEKQSIGEVDGKRKPNRKHKRQ